MCEKYNTKKMQTAQAQNTYENNSRFISIFSRFFIRDLVCLRSRWWYFFCFFSFTICFVLLWLLSLLLKFFFFISFAVGVNFFCLVFVVTAMLCCCWTHLLRFFPVCYVRLIIFDSRQMQKKPRHIHTHSEATPA